MSKETIDLMVEGGKAAATPAVSQKLGPMKINIPNVLSEINKKTDSFKGIQVPVKIIIDKNTKSFEIEVGTPPTSELIKKELKLEKGAGEPNKTKIGNLSIEQVIKIAKMKKDSMYTNSLTAAVKSVIGSAHSMGILTEGKQAPDLIPKITGGKFKKEIDEEKTETPKEKISILQQQLKQVQIELEKEFAKLKAVEEAEKAAVEVKPKEAAEVPGAEKKPETAPAAGEEAAKGEVKKEEAKPAKEAKKAEKFKKE